jgi:hypothetical protein
VRIVAAFWFSKSGHGITFLGLEFGNRIHLERCGGAWQDDLECESERRRLFFRHDLAFRVTIVLPASDVRCVHRPSLLSCDQYRSFDIGSRSICLVDFALPGIFFIGLIGG